MPAEDPGQGGTPGDGDSVPPIPDTVWRKFRDDTEQAIRASAPRELSARERAAAACPDPADAESPWKERRGGASSETGPVSLDAVGEVWEPEELWPGPEWRDMDGPARCRRAGRTLAAIAAVLVAVGVLSYASSRSSAPGTPPGDATSQQSEEALPDRVPAGTDTPSAPAYAGTPPPTPPTG